MSEVVTPSANSPVLPVGGPSAPGLAVVAARRPRTDRRQAPDGTGGHVCGVAGDEARGGIGTRTDPPAATVAAQVLFAFGDPHGVQGDTFTTVMIDLICHSDPARRDRLKTAFPLYVRAVELAVSGPEGIDRLRRVAAGPVPVPVPVPVPATRRRSQASVVSVQASRG
jgi:hypothetical protein